MTPSTQRTIWTTSAGDWVYPRDPIAQGDRITWETTWPTVPEGWPGTERLLDDFCDLERATAAEMAIFVGRYGMPELRAGVDAEVAEGQGRAMRSGWISVDALREHARAFSAARRLGAGLTSRLPGDPEDWVSLQGVGIHTKTADVTNWMLGRERLTYWLTELFRETQVGSAVEWVVDHAHLRLYPSPDTLLGAIALLLAREIGTAARYKCDVCGQSVERGRPPKDGERVYCDRPECKRERNRRNQRAWRAKQKGQGS